MRKIFSKFNIDQFEAPNLVQVQLDSYKWFLETGLKELLKDVSPIEDWTGDELELNFLDYKLEEPKYDERKAVEKNVTFEAPLKIKVGLKNKRTGQNKEQELFLADFPLMTQRGTFIINGIERVVISQLIRSPGAFFSLSRSSRYKRFFGAKLIPSRGAWLEFETEYNGVISVRIDRKRKVAATALLRAFGIADDEKIKKLFEDVDTDPNVKYILATLLQDPSSNENEGTVELYKRIRPGDPATADNAKQMVHNLFFNPARYDLSRVGRFRLNRKFSQNLDVEKTENRVLRPEDAVLIIKEIIRLNNDPSAMPDDIDHLGNHRVKTLGELLQDRLRISFARMERIIKDRMSTSDAATVLSSQLINSRPFVAALKEFVDGKITGEIQYLDASEEEKYIIAQAGAETDKNNKIQGVKIPARIKGDPGTAEIKEVNFMDVSPRQQFSVATSLIPFLEHDDANRALMGTNMQRQA